MGPNIIKALVSIQASVKPLTKSKVNPHFKSKYVPLDDVIAEVQPLLSKHGLAFVMFPEIGEGRNAIITTLLHESGEMLTSRYYLPEGIKPQDLGSHLTYYRRYFMGSIFNIATEDDDDGNAASNTRSKSKARQEVPPFAEPLDNPEFDATLLTGLDDATLRTMLRSAGPTERTAIRNELASRKAG